MNATLFDTRRVETPLDQLERTLIVEFVRGQGYNPRKVYDLSEQERLMLMQRASLYASGRLAEVESRSHFLLEIHECGAGR